MFSKEFFSKEKKVLPNSVSVGLNFDSVQFIKDRKSGVEALDKQMGELEKILGSSDLFSKQAEIFLSLPSKDRAYLAEFSEDEDLAKVVAFSLRAIKGVKRKDGFVYACHPQRVVEMILQIATDLPTDLRKRAAMIAQLHDVIEEDTIKAFFNQKSQSLTLVDLSKDKLTEIEVMRQARDSINQFLPEQQLGSAVLTVMEPSVAKSRIDEFQSLGKSKFLIIYSYFAQLLKKYANPAPLNVEIADRIDDFMDIDYILNNEKLDEKTKKDKLIRKFARCLFFIDYISHNEDGSLVEGVSEKLYLAAIELLDLVIKQQANIGHDEVIREALTFRDFIRENQKLINRDLEEMRLYG